MQDPRTTSDPLRARQGSEAGAHHVEDHPDTGLRTREQDLVPPPTAPVERPRASRATSLGSGLLLILGGLLLGSLVTLALGADSAVVDGSTSEAPLDFYLLRVAVPAIGVVLMAIAFVLRRSKLTLALVLLGILSLVGLVASKVAGEQQLTATSGTDVIQWLQVLFVVCLFAAAAVGLVSVIHGLLTLFRKGHVIRGSKARPGA